MKTTDMNYTSIQLKLPVDLEHAYIDGTKLEANANKYTWVWKKLYQKRKQYLYQR